MIKIFVVTPHFYWRHESRYTWMLKESLIITLISELNNSIVNHHINYQAMNFFCFGCFIFSILPFVLSQAPLINGTCDVTCKPIETPLDANDFLGIWYLHIQTTLPFQQVKCSYINLTTVEQNSAIGFSYYTTEMWVLSNFINFFHNCFIENFFQRKQTNYSSHFVNILLQWNLNHW